MRHKFDPERLARAALLPQPVDAEAASLWTLASRSHIDTSVDGCWYWTGPGDRNGYGRASFGRLAHRVAYQYWVGPISAGYDIDHVCHNSDPECVDGGLCPHRRCVRPDHLQERIARENRGDTYLRRRPGRSGKWRARITVNGIRRELGRYATKEEAARAQEAAAQALGRDTTRRR